MTSVLLDGLTDGQVEAVTAPRGPLVIIAGAGTGKTTTVTRRIAYLVASGEVDPSRVLAVTHSRKAAGELRDRLLRLDDGSRNLKAVTAQTFHAAALNHLHRHWAHTGRAGDGPNLLSGKGQMIRGVLRGLLSGRDISGELVSDVVDEIGWAQVRTLTPDAYPAAADAAGRTPPIPAEVVAACFARYEHAKLDAGVVDFEDLLTLAAADGMPPVRHACFIVDEYQDTDPLQERLLDRWLAGSDDLCAVGDPRQSIYAFKGAEPSFLAEFSAKRPGSRVVQLTENFRSSPQILTWANRLDRGSLTGGVTAHPLVAVRPAGPHPVIVALGGEDTETRHVVSQVQAWLREGTDPAEIAVLYRFNSQGARFQAAFAEAGIPIDAGNDGFFTRADVLGVLRPFGQHARTAPDVDGIDLLERVAAETGWDPDAPPDGAGQLRERWEAVRALLDVAGTVSAAHGGSVSAGELLDELLLRAREAHGVATGAVTVGTLHQAKGLEWDRVIITGVTEGSIPSAFARTGPALDEEKRLLYVGVTRARTHLQLTWAQTRPSPRNSEQTWSQKPSRWLSELDPSAASSAARPPARRSGSRGGAPSRRGSSGGSRGRSSTLPASMGSAPAGRGCVGCGDRLVGVHQMALRRCPDCLTRPDRQLLERIEAWRATVAAETGTPIGRVLTNAAVIGIVATRPRTVAELDGLAGTSGVGDRAEELLTIVADAPPR